MCNMQNICMKLALEIHEGNSKTSENTSELSEDSKNYVDSENVSKNVSELSEDSKNYNDSEDLSPFVPFRQDFEVSKNNVFGFP